MSIAAHLEHRDRARRRFLSTFVPDLPRPVWIIEAGMLVNSIGTGLVLPFLIIYLHDVRGFPLGVAGLVAGSFGVAGLVATVAAGPLIDHAGDRVVLGGSLLLLGAGYGSLAFVHAPWQGVVCMAAAGLGNGALWPAQSVFLVRAVPAACRHTAFSLNRMVGNAGLALGVVVGGLVVSSGATSSFELLFVLDAATFVVFAAAMVLLPAAPAGRRTRATGSYRAVLRDRPYLLLVATNTLFVAAGYAQLEAGLPFFAKHQAHVSSSAIGAIFVANVVAVVLLQMPVSRLIEGHRRTRMLCVAACAWAAAFALVAASGLVHAEAAAVGLLVAAAAVIGLAECVHGAIASPLAADLAPNELRGRYLSFVASSFAIGFAIGPVAAGAFLAWAPYALWPLAAAVCGLAAAAALLLERRLPEHALVTPVAG